MTKRTACVWCSKIIEVSDDYDDLRNKAVCCHGCKEAENMFMMFMSDEEVNRRNHYKQLTRGEDE